MGNANMVGMPSSMATRNRQVKVPFDQMLDFVMPIYYTKIPLKPHCKERLVTVWKKITSNKAKGFYQQKREKPEFTPCRTPMEFFANRFIIRLMEVHPVCQSMFKKSTLKHGTLIMNLISLLVGCVDDPELAKSLGDNIMLAVSHTKLGVRATEFGIFGEVLFWTLRLVLGSEDYDFVAHTAWIKFYSRMLDVIVPIVLQHEMNHPESANSFNVKRMMPIMDTKEMIVHGVVDTNDQSEEEISMITRAPEPLPSHGSLTSSMKTHPIESASPLLL